MPVQCAMPCPTLTEASFQDLLARFAAVRDPRHPRGIRHQVQTILAISAVAVVCGARSFAAVGEWAADAPQWVLEVVGARRHGVHGRFVAYSSVELTISASRASWNVSALSSTMPLRTVTPSHPLSRDAYNEIHAERNLAGVEPVGLSVSNSNKFDASLTGRYARVREMTQVFSSDARAAWGRNSGCRR